MPKVGEVRAKFVVDSKDWEAGLNRIESGISSVGVKVETGLGEIQGELRKTGQTAEQTGKIVKEAAEQFAFERQLQAGSAALTEIAGHLSAFGQQFSEAGEKADDLRDRLAATFGDAAEQIATLAEKQIPLGFDADQVAGALQTLNKFGDASESTLKRVEDAARFTGQDIGGLAEAFGKFDKFGDARSLLALQKAIGATNEDLIGFGARLDESTGKLDLQGDGLRRAKEAVEAYEQTNFSGAADRAADATTRYKGELELLRREIGAQGVAFKEQFAPAILEAVQSLRGLPDGVKAAIGVGTELIGTLASLGATGLQVGSQLVILSQNATVVAGAKKLATGATVAYQGAVAALSTTLGASIAVLLAVGLAIQAVINEYQKAYEEADKLTKIESDRLHGLQANRDVIGKSAAELEKMGKTSKDVTAAIGGLQEVAQQARNAGGAENEARADKAIAQIRELKKVQAELSNLEAAKKPKPGSSGGDEDELDESAKTLEKKRKQALDGELAVIKDKAAAQEIGKAQELQQLQDLLARYKAAGKLKVEEERSIQSQIASLQGQLKTESKTQQEAARKDKLDAALAEVKDRAAAGQISKTEEAQQLQQILDQFKANGEIKVEEARRIQSEIASLTGQANREQLAQQKQHHDQELAAEKAKNSQLLELKKQSLDAQKSALDQEIALAENGDAKTVDLARVKTLLDQKLQLTIREIQAERDAALKTTTDAETKAAIVEAAEQRIRAAREETTRSLESEIQKQSKAQEQQAKQDQGKLTELTKNKIDAQKSVIETQLKSLEDQIGKRNVLPQIQQLLQAKLNGTIKEIEIERDATVKATDNEQVKVAAAQAAEEKIRAAREETTAKLNEEVKKQKDALESAAQKQEEVTSRVGGKNSPLFTDPSQGFGISFGNFSLGNFNADLKVPNSPQATGTLSNQANQTNPAQAQTQPANKPIDLPALTELSDRLAETISKKLGAELAKNPIKIDVQAIVDGQDQGTQSFGGPADQLARAKNTYDPNHRLAGT